MSILMNKLASEIQLIVTRETAAGTRNQTGLMRILEWEVDAREHASASGVLVSTVDSVTHQPPVLQLLELLCARTSCVDW